MSAADESLPSDRKTRWHALFGDSIEPMFLLNRRARLLYANPAWEKLTGLSFAETRGQAFRRRGAGADLGAVERIAAALAPPPEARAGQPCRQRRRNPTSLGAVWWDVAYFPWCDAAGPLAILGKVQTVSVAGPVHALLPEKLMQLRDRFHHEHRLEQIVAESLAMQRVVAQMRLAVKTDVPVWIEGPPGSGKERIARTIHAMSSRREAPCATLDAGLLPAPMLAEKIAEAGRHWNVGTIFLKRPERLPREIQALIVQRLDVEGPAPRWLAGSSAHADDEIRAGRLLEELHCRFTSLSVRVPALADRRGDLAVLVTRLLPRASEAAGKVVTQVNSDAIKLLGQYGWPGNVTELFEILTTACGRAATERIETADLPFYMQQTAPPAERPLPLDEILAKVERRLIEWALRAGKDNKTRAAELLAIWRPRLMRRMEQLEIPGSEAPKPT